MMNAKLTTGMQVELRGAHRIKAFVLGLVLLASSAVQAQIAFRSAASASVLGPDFRAAAASNSSIDFVAAGAQTTGTGASITPAIPAGTAANDLAVLIIAGRPTDTSEPAAPAGWTLRNSVLVEVGANDLKIMTFYKVLAGGDANPVVSLPANWQGVAAGMSGQIAVWRGVDTTTPFDVADTTGSSAATQQWFAPSITTSTNGAMVVSAVATSDDNNLAFNTSSGFTLRMSGASYATTTGGDHSVAIAEKLQAAAGAVTAPEWDQVINGVDIYAAITFALRPTPNAIAIDVPAGTIQNDVMIASVGVQPSTTTITAPAGWTLVRRVDNSSATTNSLAVYSKVAGASEPASYTWTLSGATYSVGGIQSYANIDTTTPIDVENGAATASATTHATPTVTTTVANTMLVTSHTYAASRSWTPPAGMTESLDQQSGAASATGQSIEGARVLQAAAGATGTKTATAATTSARGNAHILALRPAASPVLTINKPTGTVTNDVMIASIAVQPSTATITAPAGWTLVRRIDNGSATTNSLAIYQLAAGGSEPASYTWTLGAFSHAVGGIQSFSGVDTASPIDVENGQTTASGTSHATPTVTTTVANTMLVTSHTFASSTTWTPPASMTEAFDVASLTVSNASGQSIEGSYVAQAAAGATGAKSATASGNADRGNAHILALKTAGASAPGSFNAFETNTAPAAITGVIKTRIAGSAFSLDVVAISGGAQMNSFSGNVKLELLSNTGTAGSGYGSDNCPTANSVLQTVASAAIASGRSTVNFSAVADVYRDVRVRISYPTTSPTVTTCSIDSYAIRPNIFASFAVTDTDWQTTGAPGARALNLLTFAATTPTHKAGQPFSVRATAVNAAGSPATTTNYVGAPTTTLTACVGAACTSSFGTLTLATTFAAGQLATDVASYNNVGAFGLQLIDSSFASIDSGDGSTTAERNITSAVINVGRFVPDHFAKSINAPSFQTACGAGNFTYVGQTFNYLTAPVITVTAQDASNNTTTFYDGSWWRITNASVTGKNYAAATGTLDTSGLSGTDPAIAASGSGVGTLTFGSGAGLLFTRTTPVVPFNAEIALSINVIDADGVSYVSNPVTFGAASAGNGIDFSSGKNMRFGRLRLQNANGSQLLALPIPMEIQYWPASGFGFVTHTADSCTTIASGNVAVGNPQPSGFTVGTASVVAFSAGIGSLRLPASKALGSVDVSVNLSGGTTGASCTTTPALPASSAGNKAYLQGAWCGATYVKDPTARATFGTYRNTDKFIYQQENH